MKEETYLTTHLKDLEDLKTYKACFDNNDDPKSLEHLEWMHFKNPLNKRYVDFAIHKENKDIGGLYAVFPVSFKHNQLTIVGAQSIDTLVDKNHRKKGLFKKLAKSLYQRCSEDAVKFVYGFPNIHSSFAFFNRLEWTPIADVPFMIKLINLDYIKRKLGEKNKLLGFFIPAMRIASKKKISLKEGMTIKMIDKPFGKEVDLIWEQFSKSINFSINRDAVYLNWRIFAKTSENYIVAGLYDKTALVGFVIYTVSEKHGGQVGYIVEYMYLPSYEKEARKLLAFANADLIEKKADVVLAWNFSHSPNHANIRSAGFIKFPEKLKPIKLFFGVRFFDNIKVDLRDWYISYCDSDTV